MNAHNEQHDPACIAAYEQLFKADSRDPSQTERLAVWAMSWNAARAAEPSPVVKQNLTTQPAAAQEAVAWLSKDEAQLALFKAIQAIRFGNPTDDKMILDNLRHEGLWIGRYANATVTAAPATCPQCDNTGVAHDGGRNVFCACPAGRAASTPAAPGIDLDRVQAALKYAEAAARHNTHTELAADFADLIRRIDASPKGGSGAAAHADTALAHLSNALEDLESSPDQRPVPLIREAMWHLRQMQAQAGDAEGQP